MSGVVLRCPNCGTTKAISGECEACHEAQVRYYCTNHAPGRWLDTSGCAQCGASFGDPARRPAATPSPAPSQTPTLASASTSAPRRTSITSWGPLMTSGGPWHRRKRLPSTEEGPESHEKGTTADYVRGTKLPELLRRVSRVRRMPEEATPVLETAPIGPVLGGCFLRALFIMAFLFISLVVVSILAGGALLQSFGSYY